MRSAVTVNVWPSPHLVMTGDGGVLPRLCTITFTGAGLMTTVNCLDAVLASDWLSLAVTMAMNVPDAVGVPLMVPSLLMASPVGRPLAVHSYGGLPPVALTLAPA